MLSILLHTNSPLRLFPIVTPCLPSSTLHVRPYSSHLILLNSGHQYSKPLNTNSNPEQQIQHNATPNLLFINSKIWHITNIRYRFTLWLWFFIHIYVYMVLLIMWVLIYILKTHVNEFKSRKFILKI
jgi:hypothetical protein